MNQTTETKIQLAISPPDFKEIKKKAEKLFDLLDVSETTREDYKKRITLFLKFIRKNGLNKNSFLEFKRFLASKNDYTIATKNKYLATAKIFLKELNRQGFLPVDITQNIKSFKQDKKHKREGLNEEEIKRLTERLQQLPDTPENTRLKAIISLLLFQGLRQVEVIRLDVKDIDFVNQIAFVRGKGRDDKEPIVLHPETIKNLRKYIETNKVKDGALFYSKSNNHKNQRLTTRALREIVKRFFKLLNIEKTTHGFRHFFTTQLIKAYRGDLLKVAQFTRHRSLEMLQVYNDNIKNKKDLPRFFRAFSTISF